MSLPASDYISLPLLGQDSSSRPTSGPSIHAPKKDPPPTHHKRNFLLRISAFSILELGFIIFAFIAGRSPVVLNLPSSTTLTEAKGAFTVIFILWHALAAFTVKGIIFHIFSAEWMEQYRTSGDLVPGKTDIVSRITAGYIEQIQHFKSNKATFTFRVGFISILLLVVLNALGPSTISVSSITLHRPSTTQVANLTKTLGGLPSEPWEGDRANLVTRFEYLACTEYGFTVNGTNILIPWPSPTPTSTQEVVTYESDVVIYNFSCSWKQPTIKTGYLIAGNMSWFMGSDKPNPWVLPLATNLDGGNSSLSAFLFIGGNSIIDTYAPDLNDIPSLFVPEGTVTPFIDTSLNRLCSVLICDPQMHLAPATVTISGDFQLQATPRSGRPVIKNISPDAANVVFSESLLIATSSTDSYTSPINPISVILFLPSVPQPLDEALSGLKPLSLDKINQNMNKMLMSSAKAYLSGYRVDRSEDPANPSFTMVDTHGTIEVQVLALTASRLFLIGLLVVFGILVVFFGFIIIGGQVNELQTFDLENIVRTLNAKVD